MKTVETKLSSENIVKIEKMSDGRWKITQSSDPKYGFETNIEKNVDGVWVVNVKKRSNGSYSVRMENKYRPRIKRNHRPPTSSLIRHSSPFFEELGLPYTVSAVPQRIFDEPKYKDSIIELPAGEIVDIKKMSDGTWVITQNVDEEQS